MTARILLTLITPVLLSFAPPSFMRDNIGTIVINGRTIYVDEKLPVDNVHEESFSLQELDTIRISYLWESLRIEQTEGESLILKEFLSEDNTDYYARTHSKNNTLSIEAGNTPKDDPFNRKAEIYVPKGFSGNINVDSLAGTILWNIGDQRFNSVSLNTSSGEISGDSVSASAIRLKGQSGDVEFKNLRGNSLTLSTSMGDVKLQSLELRQRANIEARSGSVAIPFLQAASLRLSSTIGRLNLDRAELSQDAQISSDSGEIDIGRISAESIGVSSSMGNVRADFIEGNITYENTSGSMQVRETRGSGTFKSRSGSIELTCTAAAGDLNFSTDSGRIRFDNADSRGMQYKASTKLAAIYVQNDNKGRETSGRLGEGGTYTANLTSVN